MFISSPPPEQLLSPASLVRVEDVRTAPKEKGVYGWWFEAGSLRVPAAEHPASRGFELLYVGIAPRKPTGAGIESKSRLRGRLVSHASKDASRSTLRLTLGVLLQNELGLTLGMHKSRVNWAPAGEQALTEWMRQHARVSWITSNEPWIVEDELLNAVALPLNISGKYGTFTQSLSARRREATRIARAKF
jgi:hypothetical protein